MISHYSIDPHMAVNTQQCANKGREEHGFKLVNTDVNNSGFTLSARLLCKCFVRKELCSIHTTSFAE